MSKNSEAKLPSPRWAMLNEFVDESARHVGPAEALVWLALFRLAQRDGRVRRSQETIAKVVGVSVRSVRTAIHRLEACGLLRVVRKGGPGRGPTAYSLSGRILPPYADRKSPRTSARKNSSGQLCRKNSSPSSEEKDHRVGCDDDPFDPTEYPDAADYERSGANGEPGDFDEATVADAEGSVERNRRG